MKDLDWIDKYGACKICEGEIPYGHQPKCTIYKFEKERKRLKARIEGLEKVEEHARHLLAGGDKEAVHNLEKALAAL